MAVKTPTEKCISIAAAADTSGAGGTLIVKASKLASQMNNRLYRQTRNYRVSFSLQPKDLDSYQDSFSYSFYTLPNTWFVHGAIKYAFRTYMQAHEDEIRAGVKFARWHDFTIDEQDPDGTWEHSQALLFDGDAWAGIGSDESPADSSITLNDGSTTKVFRLMGTDSGAFNIFKEYANLLNYSVPDTEAVTSDQPYEGLLDLKDADKMAEVGDRAPYDRDFSSFLDDGSDDQNILNYQDAITFDGNSGAVRAATKQFDAPLGLIWVRKEDNGNDTDFAVSTPELCLHLAKGNYKGINAPSIL